MTARNRFFAMGAACVAAAAAAATSVSAQNLPEIGEGQCFYADRYAPLLAEGVFFVDCDSVRIERAGDNVVFRFIDTGRRFAVEFRTQPEGERWKILETRQQDRRWRPAIGMCELFRRDGEISVVTCVTMRGVVRYAANFEVGRGVSSRSQPELRP
ncbi:hypothetical protein [Erythrobacter sp. KY5]|uniref:hypothetical protein n=1 Tax=Erythrobacter sp. KY5 TaxID=2011159 RepID=UPI0013A6DEE5|nr:hypothetical protein [Erythrobacter sp. KY5]